MNQANSSFPDELQAKNQMVKMGSAAGKQNDHFSKYKVQLFENDCIGGYGWIWLKDVTMVEVYSTGPGPQNVDEISVGNCQTPN